MPHRVYVGPHDEVELMLTGDVVRRGEQVEVTAEVAELLDAQPTNWAKPTTKKAKQTPTAAPAPEPAAVTVDGQTIEEGDQ